MHWAGFQTNYRGGKTPGEAWYDPVHFGTLLCTLTAAWCGGLVGGRECAEEVLPSSSEPP